MLYIFILPYAVFCLSDASYYIKMIGNETYLNRMLLLILYDVPAVLGGKSYSIHIGELL